MKIFKVLDKNRVRGKDLDKKSRLLRIIFLSKKFIGNSRKKVLISKNESYNKQLSTEFLKNLLSRKIFKILKQYYNTAMESHRE